MSLDDPLPPKPKYESGPTPGAPFDEPIILHHNTFAEGHMAGVEFERARCRAIVLKHFGNEWRGNEALAEIGE